MLQFKYSVLIRLLNVFLLWFKYNAYTFRQIIIDNIIHPLVLSDIFVKIELFTYSHSVTIYLHYVMWFFFSYVHCGTFY